MPTINVDGWPPRSSAPFALTKFRGPDGTGGATESLLLLQAEASAIVTKATAGRNADEGNPRRRPFDRIHSS